MTATAVAIPPAATADPIWTYQDLLDLPDDGQRYELLDGALLMSASPVIKHQELSSRLHLLAGPYVRDRGLGAVWYAPLDVYIGEHDVVQPDLLFILQDRLHLFPTNDVVRLPPDLVVEIASPSTRRRDLIAKARLYAGFGVPEYWQVDADAPGFRLLALKGRQYQEVPPVAGRFRSLVIPGLEIDPAALFANLE